MDIYAFGMLFFELLTGMRAVNGDTIEAVMYQILNVPLDPAPMVNAGVPPRAQALVLRCVEKRAEDRPQSFRVVVEELRGLISGRDVEKTQPVAAQTVPIPVNAPPPRRSRAIWAATGVLLVVGSAGAVWWATHGKGPHPSPAAYPQIIRGMIYIPAGSFLSGSKDTPASLPAYYIDETEVSNADFAEYCRATGCAAPEGSPDLPVVRVTIAQARDYAKWKGKRLPSALEWERAARGTKGARFPWGDAEDASLANVAGTALKPVKSYAAYPEYQMAGNAWEMVEGEITPSAQAVASFSSLLKPPPAADEKWIWIRGGSFNTPLAAAAGYEWSPIPERYSSSDIGFRCAKPAP